MARAAPQPTRDLALYLTSRGAGTVGIQIQSVAVGWQIYSRTGQPMDLAYVGLAQFLPLAALSLVGGNVADRRDRRQVLAISRLVSAACSLALLFFGLRPEWGVAPVYGVLALLGATRAFAGPAAVGLLPWLVTAEHLPRAVALSSSTFQLGTIAGPAVGGLLYAVGGPAGAYGTAAACALLSGALVAALRARPPARSPAEAGGLGLLLEGVRFVWREKVILGAIGLDLCAVLLGGAVALMPIFARDVLHVGATGLGILRAAPAVGALAVAGLLAVRPLESGVGRWLFVSVALFGVATIVFGLSESFALSVAALVALGAADMVSVVIRGSLVQLWTPDAMRGRVASVNLVFIGASNELGEFESGVTAAWLGTVAATVLGGVGTLLVTAVFAAAFPALRRIDTLAAPARARDRPPPAAPTA